MNIERIRLDDMSNLDKLWHDALKNIKDPVVIPALNPIDINHKMFTIKEVIFHEPATIVKWKDGTKTVVKCQEGDTFDPEKGLAMCFVKKLMGNQGKYNNVFKKNLLKWCCDEKECPHKGGVKMDEKVMYLVTFDGYNSYGCDIYCRGLFDMKEKAEEATKQLDGFEKEIGETIAIHEIPVNKVFEVTKRIVAEEYDCGYQTDLHFGGYHMNKRV